MNILFTTYQGGLAGSTYSISYLAKGLAAKGHKVVVAGKAGSLLFKLLEDTPVECIDLPFRSKVDWTTVRALRQIIVAHKIYLVNAQSSVDRYLTIFARWFYRLDTKLVHTRRQRSLSIGGWLQNNFYVKGTDKIVVISDALKEQFIQRGYPAKHLHVIYNGTPPEQYEVDGSVTEKLRVRLGILPTDQVVGCVARMKRQDQLVAALPHVDPTVKVLFIGIEPGSLNHLVERYDVKNQIIYAGDLSRTETLASYRLMDVNVLPSDMDGFGLVLVEAMAMGTPVIGTNFGGIKDVIEDGVSGLLYENGDSLQLAEAVTRVLQDAQLRDRLITNGQRRALEDFAIQKTIDNYEAFFQKLING
ncbi:MAG: glycosyltransferase family 4 protein [Tunicatimonas sp.]